MGRICTKVELVRKKNLDRDFGGNLLSLEWVQQTDGGHKYNLDKTENLVRKQLLKAGEKLRLLNSKEEMREAVTK